MLKSLAHQITPDVNVVLTLQNITTGSISLNGNLNDKTILVQTDPLRKRQTQNTKNVYQTKAKTKSTPSESHT